MLIVGALNTDGFTVPLDRAGGNDRVACKLIDHGMIDRPAEPKGGSQEVFHGVNLSSSTSDPSERADSR